MSMFKEHKLSMFYQFVTHLKRECIPTLQALPRDTLSTAREVFSGVQIWKRGIILHNNSWFLWGTLNALILQLCDFPSLSSAASINLSVIVPAYNEEERLPKVCALNRK